jgi:hypothetical protein
MGGIDYGMGQTNINHETGIRYGVIPMHDIPWWNEEAESNYGEPSCPKCSNPAQDIDKAPENYGELSDWEDNGNDYCCLDCKYTFESWEAFGDEPLSWFVDNGEYLAEQTRDDSDIFVFKSPYYTRAQFCSPCAPGACYLLNPEPDGAKAYCFGHDWFDGGKAPYPVYRVDDDTEVSPEEGQ